MSSHFKYQNKNSIFQMSLFGYKLENADDNIHTELWGTCINKVLIKIKLRRCQKQLSALPKSEEVSLAEEENFLRPEVNSF